jgi:hypothetical protein
LLLRDSLDTFAWTCSVVGPFAVRRDPQQRQLAEEGLAAEEEGVNPTKVASTAAPISSLKYGKCHRSRASTTPSSEKNRPAGCSS